MKLQVFVGTARSGKTSFLAEKMQDAHRENPLSYTFRRPSGVFGKEFSGMVRETAEFLNPHAQFLVIGQFAVELFGCSLLA